ncbi:sugar transferase [Pseudooceanicola nanhaiensis]|uniref:sugar transferase n=1 Tax=Pseudooceanicola nanhaiensis TaxID=375761 RepID=UPI001CD35DD2|nr:sugar transferase [Pseudooceanicola nanhaiensis]MCA0920377.1 sugar transferase [Pseudooceanicola nanhaiensis]
MTFLKRLMDLTCCLLITAVLWPVFIVVALTVLIRDGRPVFYLSERMKTPETGFQLVKFRTMRVVSNDSGVSGGDKADRITPTGRVLRRYRLDEMPQVWNVLRGDISFVGPRPPLRRYVEQFPALYADVLKSRPGLTGLATVAFHAREAELLATCRTAEETEAVYTRRCVPAKARLDLIYARNRTICLDIWLMLTTVFRRLPLAPGRQRPPNR